MQIKVNQQIEVVTVWDRDLTKKQLVGIKELFDNEYAALYGAWNQTQPYGYSPAELHVLAVKDGQVVGNIGMQRRQISVGNQEVTIAGTGGMLISPSYRKYGLGRKLLSALQEASRTIAPVDYGYLGCREDVVPFYEASGYTRIVATERFVSDDDQITVIQHTGSPIMICSGTKAVKEWPTGTIDIRGTAW